MLTPKFVREHADEVRDTLRRQKADEAVLDAFLEAEAKWRALKQEVDALRAERNRVSEEINTTKKAGGDITPLLERAKKIPGKIKELEGVAAQLYHDELLPLLRRIPNIMHPEVPYGKDEDENVEVKRWGAPKEFSFPVKNHVELCEENGWADFEESAKTSGNGFYFLKGDLALLNQALIRFAINHLTSKGYTYVEPPLLVRKHILDAAMDTTAFDQSIYRVVDEGEDPLCLIGTAEHAILGMYEGTTLSDEELPRKYVGYSMCFRQEIGSHGINEKGLWRTHQFNKVEQFIFSLPEESWQLYEELLRNSEELLQALQLPYRVVEICTGDLAVWKARSHDIEVWRPTTQSYGEVMSLSNCTSYQSMDLNIRYVKKNGERGYVHTLNNTALATSRIMVALLENYQTPDGSVTIPAVLRPFLQGKKLLEARK